MRSAASAAPTAAGTPAAVKRKARDWMRRNSITSREPATKPPHEARLFENVPIRRSQRSSTPNSSAVPAPRAPSTPAACASSTIRRAPKRAHSSTICGSGATSPSIENTPSTTTRTPPPSPAAFSSVRSSRSSRLWRNGRSLARDSRQPSRIEAWSPESAITVSPGPRIVPSVPTLAWWPVVKTIASSVPIQAASSASSSRCSPSVPLRSREPVRPGPVALERVARALHDARVAGEPEVVVGAEHDALGALHLHHGRRGRLEAAEVREQVGVAGGVELLDALVTADLREDVSGGRHIGCPPPWGSRFGGWILGGTFAPSSSFPSGSTPTSPTGSRRCASSAASSSTAGATRSSSTRRAEYYLALRDGRPVGRITAQVDDNFQRFQDNRWGQFGFFEAEQRPRRGRGAAGHGGDVAARPRLRPHGRAVRLHHQRRVRRAARGPRAHPAHPLALDAPLLPRAARGGGRAEGDGPAHVGAPHHRQGPRQQGDLEARRPGRAALRHRRAALPQARPRRGGRPLHRGLQRRVGEELGLRPAHGARGPPLRQDAASRSSTRTGPTWPRRTGRRSARRSRCPTTTRSCAT